MILGTTRAVRAFAYPRPTDLRNGYNGLFGLVKTGLVRDPLSGELFLFVNKRRDACKVLVFDGTGLCIFQKKLARGRFAKLWREDAVAVRLTAAGRMLDFRYRVTDPAKASVLLNRKTKAHAIHLPTGETLGVPRMARVGRMKSSAVEGKKDKVYFMFFDARRQQVKSGDRVTVVIGEHRFEGLAVQ